MPRTLRCVIASGLFAVATSAAAESGYPFQEYERQVQAARSVTALDAGAFGETTNAYNGATEFAAVDIDLPGNDALPVRLGRRFAIEDRYGMQNLGGFGDWDIDVPYIEATVDANEGWTVAAAASADELRRCSLARAPDVPSLHFELEEVFAGIRVHLPGKPGRELMKAAPGAFPAPADGQAYPWITRELDRVRCLGATRNGYPGEGFVLVSGDGLRYRFDWAVERRVRSLRKGPEIQHALARKRVFLLATRVEDRFGNRVDYTWQGERLTAIEASDGRRIALEWEDDRVVAATATGRAWNYEYADDDALDGVVNPDGSRWRFERVGDLHPVAAPQLDLDPFAESEPNCVIRQPEIGGAFAYTLVHPGGARGTFLFRMQRHYRVDVPYRCHVDVAPHDIAAQTQVEFNATHIDWDRYAELIEEGFAEEEARSGAYVQVQQLQTLATNKHVAGYLRLGIPNYFDNYSLQSRSVEGPGLAAATTQFDYGLVIPFGFCGWTSPGCIDICDANGCYQNGVKWATVTRPDGARTRRQFGIRYGVDEGRLLQEQEIAADGTVLRETRHAVVADADAPAQVFPASYGEALTPDPMLARLRPLLERVVTQQGTTFRWHADAFDALARPVAVTRSSSLGFSAADAMTFHDDVASWTLGALKSRRTAGIEAERTDFDALARPIRHYRFGALAWTRTWRSDGTLASQADGNGRSTAFESWHRGVPRTILHADATRRTATVDEAGWITSATDENGFTTGYGYDAMGRLAVATPPTGDTVAWLRTTIAFVPVATEEHGLAPGHWRRTEATGNRRTVTWYDGLWRPRLVQEYDTADPAGTQRFRAWRYDDEGRTTFVADPVASVTTLDALTAGTTRAYDALGRLASSTRTSELGPLVTRFDYLPGFRTQVTDPRNGVTSTSYQAFDAPATAAPVQVVAASGTPREHTTTITRDVFGKAMAVQRSGTHGGVAVSATRRLVYDPQQRLCKTIDPESGAQLFAYDAAGNLAWSAPGTSLTTAACDRAQVTAAQKIVRTWDARNRPTALTTPDGVGNLAWAYTPDGLVASVTAMQPDNVAVTTSYAYNRLRLPTSQSQVQPGIGTWSVQHGYTPGGDTASLGYPNGTSVAFAPNALGQPTRVGTWATAIAYHPDGTVRRFTYGNGVVHTQSLNARGLPAQRRDAGAMPLFDERYAYDAAGNLLDSTDAVDGKATVGMAYDELDRLTLAVAPDAWGEARYTHDGLDNLRTATLGLAGFTYAYDAGNRLANVARTVAGAYPYTTDARGNVTGDGRNAYRYDLTNRMLGVTGREDYRYDGLGRRTAALRPGGNAFWLYDRAGRLLYTLDARRNVRVNHVYLGDRLVAELAQPVAGGATTATYVHTDLLGSPAKTSDATGALRPGRRHTPFGVSFDGAADGVDYTGHVADLDTGLVYAQQRYYDPLVGRFLSVDPVAVGEFVRDFNRYSYARNNPYRYIDPDGRLSIPGVSAPNDTYCKGDCQSEANRESRALDWVHPLPGATVVQKGKPAPYSKSANGEFDPTGSRGLRRNDDGSRRPHKGLDLLAEVGTPVQSGRHGTVVCSGSCGRGWGISVLIDHGNGWQQRYAHLSKTLVDRGDDVSTGEFVGRTGRTDIPARAVPHLHLELRHNGVPIDPRVVLDREEQ